MNRKVSSTAGILLLILLGVSTAGNLYADKEEIIKDLPDRFSSWIKKDGIHATRGTEKLKVFEDPLYNSNYALLKGKNCWLIDLEDRTVSYPSCAIFKMLNDELSIDKETFLSEAADSRSKVPGYPWIDNQLDCGAYISALFRKPTFKKFTIKFWDCDEWIQIELPEQDVPNTKKRSLLTDK